MSLEISGFFDGDGRKIVIQHLRQQVALLTQFFCTIHQNQSNYSINVTLLIIITDEDMLCSFRHSSHTAPFPPFYLSLFSLLLLLCYRCDIKVPGFSCGNQHRSPVSTGDLVSVTCPLRRLLVLLDMC